MFARIVSLWRGKPEVALPPPTPPAAPPPPVLTDLLETESSLQTMSVEQLVELSNGLALKQEAFRERRRRISKVISAKLTVGKVG